MQRETLSFLIVEDHPIVRRGLKDILADEYPQAVFGEAGDSPAAIQELCRRKWDVVLLDISIPGRGGLDVLSDVRRLCRKAKVLVVSVYPEGEFAVRAFKLGADGYLSKNQASEELAEAVRTILSGRKYVTASLAQRLAATLDESKGHSAPHEALSAREMQVLAMVAAGKSIKKVAAELALSEKTIGTYRARIAAKTGLSTNVELTRYAFQHGLAH